MGISLILLLAFGTLTVGVLRTMTSKNQTKHDSERVTYVLKFPADLDGDRVLAWLRAISRTLTSSLLHGAQSMAFETVATEQGIIHRLIVPKNKQDDIIPQLRALAPGITATPEDRPLSINWTRAVEVGETNKDRPLSISDVTDVSHSILASLQPLSDNEAIAIQWVISPARQQALPQTTSSSSSFSLWKWFTSTASSDEIKERRTKLAEPNVMAVLRVATSASDDDKAKRLISRVKTSYNALISPHNAWFQVATTNKGAIARVKTAASLPTWPAQLSVSELSAVIAWPIGSPHVSGLPRGASRQLPANVNVPRSGIIIGTSTFPENPRPVALSYEGGLRHTHVVGGTGTGKTTLLTNMIEQDMSAGHTVIVLEAKGDLFYHALAHVPKDRINDVIVVDVNDRAFPVGYNILKEGEPRAAASRIKNLFEHHFPELQRGSPLARSALHRGLETLATRENAAFTDIVPLFMPAERGSDLERWQKDVMQGVTDYELREFWETHTKKKVDEQRRYTEPLMNRAWLITEVPEVRNIVGQSTSSFTFEQILRENKIILINLSGIASDTAELMGTFFMQGLWNAVQQEQGRNKSAFLYIDEFQSFLRLPISPEEMLSKARSFKLGMRLAHQYLGQLSTNTELSSAVMSNAFNKIMFQLSERDATPMAREFGSLVTPHDFVSLRNYEAFAKVMTDEGTSQPFSMQTYPESRPTGYANQIIELSRAKYGRPVNDVITEMRARRSVPESPTANRTRFVGEEW